MNPQDYNIPHKQQTEKKNTWFFSPFIITVLIVISDQITKMLVLKKIPPLYSSPDNVVRISEDFLWFINVTNRGAVFSFGANFGDVARLLMIYILPILLLIFIGKILIYSSWHKTFRWIAGGIIGGGIGNMIDRVFRPAGVVDFISVKFYGLFGMERWPTFNIADSAIVLSMIIWIICTFTPSITRASKKPNLEQDNEK